MAVAKITEINIYPIKSAKAVSLQSVSVNSMGLAGDREFAFVKDSERIGQKQIRNILHVGTERVSDSELRITYPGRPDYLLDLNTKGSDTSISLYSKTVATLDMGDAVASWASAALGESVRLARINGAAAWFFPVPEFSLVDGQAQNKFVDAAPILLTNESSLADLNARMDVAVPMNRFRANIVVSGLQEYLEDELSQFEFPGTRLERVAVCERCIMTTIDQTTGDMSKDPLNTLAKYRKRDNGYAGGIMFGIYLSATAAGILSVGDELDLAEATLK